jgi:predicted nucleic acid-binding protein
MIYLDSSYIFKCYINEPGTSRVLSLVQKSSGCGSGFHARAEFWSGLHRRVCEIVTSIQDARKIWRQFEQDERAGVWHWLPLNDLVVRRACDAFERLPSNVFLRSADALHLACAAENRFTEVYSGDRILLGAAPHFGLKGVSVY